MLDVMVRRGAPLIAAVALGLLAFAADAVDGPAGQVAVALVSSGLSWGLAALLTGWAAPDRRAALVHPTALLAAATLAYYLLILVVSRRWSGGTPTDGYGLRSLAVTALAWLLVAALTGPAFGLLGRTTRTAAERRAALAAGTACGLLSGQGWQEVALPPPWNPTAFDDPTAYFSSGIGAGGAILIALPLAALAWLATRRRLWPAWPTLIAATVAAAAASALCRQLLRAAADRLG